MEIDVPTTEERENGNIATSNPDFYRVELDADFLYQGTEYQDMRDKQNR